ncbi:MAG: 16S rRNA (guanine(527)-N(7))-methyltransferase RsmG [Terriglobia bacterium]
MLDESGVRAILEPFQLELSPSQISQLLAYLDLLLRWNRKINLTSIRTDKECVTRHFGESLYLARWIKLQGNLLDIGSGAGFPGLALRIAFPELATTLLEPVAKKRAFLKEAARVCGVSKVDVRPERLEDFARQSPRVTFDTITARAVGHFDLLVPQALSLLKADGRICLWIGQNQGQSLLESAALVQCGPPIAMPIGREREIWVGTRKPQ